MLSNGQALWAHCSTQLHHIVRQHPFAPRLAAGRGRQRRLRRAHLAARPGRGGRHRAADEGRDLERVRAGRDARSSSTARRSCSVRSAGSHRMARASRPSVGQNRASMTQPALPTPRFDIFYRHDELTRLLFDYAEAHPTLVAVRSIGKSHEGRDIWVATRHQHRHRRRHRQAGVLGRRQHPRRRADRLAPRCLYYLHHAGDAATAATPTVTAAARHAARSTSARASTPTAPSSRWPTGRATSARRRGRYPFDEEPVDGLTVEDVDGDGRVLFMRIADPHGTYKKCDGRPAADGARASRASSAASTTG